MAIATTIGKRGVNDVIMIASSWDGWVEGKTASYGVATTMINDPTNKTSVTTRYGYRAPLKSDGTAYPDNWYQNNTGNSAAEQAAADDQAKLLGQAGITARSFFWYPLSADITSGSFPSIADFIIQSLLYYLASPNKTAHKFCLNIPADWASADATGATNGTWLNFSNHINRWLTWFADPQYLKVDGNRPVISMYEGAGVTQWDATHVSQLTTAVTGAGMGAPYYIQPNGDATAANALGFDGITTYGPNPVPVGSGQLSYSNLLGQNKTNWSIAGSLQERVLPITCTLDTRPRGYVAWFDWPIYSEFERRLRRDYAMARSSRSLCPHSMMFMYSINENDEGGGIFPSAQRLARGVNSGTMGPMLDAFKNVTTGVFPSTFDDHYHAASAHSAIVRTGGVNWTIQQDLPGASGGTTGAFQYSENRNSTVGNTWVWTSPNNVTRIKLYGGNGAAYGTFNCHVDSNADTLVTQTAGAETRNVLLFDSSALTAGVHSLTCTVVTGCFIDELVATVSR